MLAQEAGATLALLRQRGFEAIWAEHKQQKTLLQQNQRDLRMLPQKASHGDGLKNFGTCPSGGYVTRVLSKVSSTARANIARRDLIPQENSNSTCGARWALKVTHLVQPLRCMRKRGSGVQRVKSSIPSWDRQTPT